MAGEQNQILFNAMEEEIVKVGIVVRDAIDTAKRYSRMFQLGPWSFYDLEPTLEALQGEDRGSADFGVRVAANVLGDKRIELIQPLYGPSAYSRFLDERGGGVHHLSFGSVGGYDEIVAGLEEFDLSVEMAAVYPGSQRLTQFGSMSDLGVFLEVADSAPADREPWGQYEPDAPGWAAMEGKRIAQIGIVTEDAEGMARRYHDVLGIGTWYLYDFKPPIGRAQIFHDVPVRPDNQVRLLGAIVDHPNLQFELLEPRVGPSTHLDYLRAVGEGAHHLSLDILEDHDEFVAGLQRHGVGIEMAGLAGLAFQYTYLETGEDLGTLFEVLKFFPEEDEWGGLYGTYPPEEE